MYVCVCVLGNNMSRLFNIYNDYYSFISSITCVFGIAKSLYYLSKPHINFLVSTVLKVCITKEHLIVETIDPQYSTCSQYIVHAQILKYYVNAYKEILHFKRVLNVQ